MENKALMALVNVAQKSALDMTEVMKHRLTDICLPLFNIDRSIRKAMKSKLLECFQFNMENTRSNIAIIDMGLIWRTAMPSKSKREAPGGTRLTWRWYAENMLNLILNRHPDAKEIHLINDRYDVELSIKKGEHNKRSAKYNGGSRNIFPKGNQVVPSVNTFNVFFTNSGNKIRLQKFLQFEFQRVVKDGVDLYYTVDNNCYHLNRGTLRLEYNCYHHEADTKIFYHADLLARSRNDVVLTIDSADTDVVCIAAYFAHTTEIPVFLYKKGKLHDCRKLCSLEVANIIIPFHAYTGADAVSGFFGHSKATTFKRLGENIGLLNKLGKEVDITDEIRKDLELFTISVIYNDKNSKSLNEARANKWRKMKKKGILTLPPDYDSFEQHLKRANYVAYTWLNFHYPDPPNSPLTHGFDLKNKDVVPVMHTLPALPLNFEELIDRTPIDDEESDISDIDSDCFHSDID